MIYKGYEIDKDDLGRYRVCNPESPYSKDSDHRVYGNLADAKQAVSNSIEDKYSGMVHQLKNGRWVIACWVERANQWQAPMTAREAKLTGCHTYFAGTLEGLGCTSYSTKSNAIRRLKQEYECEEAIF